MYTKIGLGSLLAQSYQSGMQLQETTYNYKLVMPCDSIARDIMILEYD